MHAQRLLVERGKTDVVPELIAMANDQGVDAIGLNVGAIHALWTLQGLKALDSPAPAAAVQAALKHPSAGVRRNAAQVLPRTAQSASAILAANLLADLDAQVRLAALLALAEMPASDKVAAALVDALDEGLARDDRWLADAATAAAARNDLVFLKAMAGRRQGDAG